MILMMGMERRFEALLRCSLIRTAQTYLSGMPECRFGMNDKVLMESEPNAARRPGKKGT